MPVTAWPRWVCVEAMERDQNVYPLECVGVCMKESVRVIWVRLSSARNAMMGWVCACSWFAEQRSV